MAVGVQSQPWVGMPGGPLENLDWVAGVTQGAQLARPQTMQVHEAFLWSRTGCRIVPDPFLNMTPGPHAGYRREYWLAGCPGGATRALTTGALASGTGCSARALSSCTLPRRQPSDAGRRVGTTPGVSDNSSSRRNPVRERPSRGRRGPLRTPSGTAARVGSIQ